MNNVRTRQTFSPQQYSPQNCKPVKRLRHTSLHQATVNSYCNSFNLLKLHPNAEVTSWHTGSLGCCERRAELSSTSLGFPVTGNQMLCLPFPLTFQNCWCRLFTQLLGSSLILLEDSVPFLKFLCYQYIGSGKVEHHNTFN